MAPPSILFAFLLSPSLVAAWQLTNYYNVSRLVYGTTTFANTVQVTPIGSVSATSSNVTTTSIYASHLLDFNYQVTYVYTLTNIFVDPAGSWCVPDGFGHGTRDCSKTSSTRTTPTALTRYFAPVVITPPSSCTKTSFSYTSSQQVTPTALPSGMGSQATDSSEALYITTYVVTLSTDKGGQAVTTSVVDVYLSSDAVQGVQPVDQSAYLSQCIDPSSVLCASSAPGLLNFGCGAQPLTYPPKGQVTGGGSTTSGASPAATTTKSGAGGMRAAAGWVTCFGFAVVAGWLFV